MPAAIPVIRVVRSGFTESWHHGSVAVVDADGQVVASAGDVERVAFARSSMKPVQAAVSVGLAGEAGLSQAEIAVMCGSHNGEPVHLDAVRSILDRAGLGFEALRTPATLPLDAASARQAPEPRPELHNCSGKHAGMLLACARRGWPLDTYREPDHPLQRAVLEAVRHLAGEEPGAIGVDGCGVPVHALSLRALARMYAGLVTGGAGGPAAGGLALEAVVSAMRAEPYMVAGRDRVCTAVMGVADVIVKVGAEGLVCAGVVGRGLGVAIKIEDGNPRALDPAIVHALRLLDALPDDPSIEPFARPPVLGGGAPVGSLEPVFELDRR